ncbi:alpha/beta hydrolase [Arcticibacter sp. MXS-1]|uniref:alpha/beta hydrolase n=1 Tax=Arcticibacter sp. MXS-1 TaxID=3341726 RepID=UPI0035A86FFE
MRVQRRTFDSKVLGEQRIFDIYRTAETGGDSGAPCTLLLVLDGEDHFSAVVDVLSQSEVKAGYGVIAAGLGNKDLRVRDYTPTAVKESSFLDPDAIAMTGGGGKFLSFLESELLPHLHSEFRGINRTAIIGHSLGGLEVLHILLERPALFQHYVAIEPSLWYDHHSLLNEAKRRLADEAYLDVHLFLAVADSVGKHLTVSEIREDTSKKGDLIRPNVELADLLNSLKDNMNFKWKYYPEYNHFSVAEVAIPEAVFRILS